MLYFILLNLTLLPPDGTWELNTDQLPDPPQFLSNPCVAANGHIYFLDSGNHRIYHLDENGRFMNSFGRSGEGPGEFSFPNDMALLPEKNQIFVVDAAKEKMVVFDGDGKALNPKINIRNGSNPGIPFVLSEDEALFILSTFPLKKVDRGKGAKVVKRYDDDRPDTLVATFDSQQHEDWFTVSRGGLRLPWHRQTLIAVSPDKKTFYLGNNDRIKMTRYRSKDLQTLGVVEDKTVPRPPLTDEEVKKQIKSLSQFGKPISWSDLDPPKSKPTVKGMLVDEAGRLWVALVNKFEQQGKTYRVYGVSGSFVGQLTLGEENIFHANQTHFWSTYENEDGDQVIAKRTYRLDPN